MDFNEKRIFIVLEEHMISRYRYLIKKFAFEEYNVLGLGEFQIGSKPNDILNRIMQRNVLQKEYDRLSIFIKEKCGQHNIKEIYLSNSEGYIAYNFILKIKKEFPTLKLIGLQHGVFKLKRISNRSFRNLMNSTFNLIFGVYPFGGGFGCKIVDEYIVYNSAYKTFLIENYKWNENQVKVDLPFLKCELFDKKIDKQQNNTVLFLPQCLAKANLCSKNDEELLHNKVLLYLIKKYDKVLIKEHPACRSEISFVKNKKIVIIDDLIDGFNTSSYAYSFTSTTLLEADIFNIETFAIKSKLISGDKSLYELFKNTLNFEETICK
ncbi:polysialyltransferase family glycosyltransferase [Cellulophaga baltica]|uniref:polysialyltransferase family glycosyltransferase n=1 Tax=Cellulophaga baltica TaxID=76594 RepID=UPI00249492CA|nr:hypothetical protein [Cellulophaga baltica]